MSIQKQLIVVVEDTATLADDWPSILADYLEKIIRSFAGKGLVGLGKCNPTSEDHVVDNGKHHNFIVLISETFLEACDALRHASVPKANQYVKAWKGNLWACESGKRVLDARLEGYRKSRLATTLTSNSYFPSTIIVKQVITQDQYNDILERHVIDDFVAFRTESTDPWFQLLHEKKMCAVIPYQLRTMASMPKTLLLIDSRDANFRLKGVVLYADVKDLFSTSSRPGAATRRNGKASKKPHGGYICVRRL
ncbi:hypothetical protein ACFE04_018636 [Oxalis oulophora]